MEKKRKLLKDKSNSRPNQLGYNEFQKVLPMQIKHNKLNAK